MVAVSLIPYRSGYPAWAVQLIESRWSMRLRIALVGAIHLTALTILVRTEHGPFATAMAIVTWTLLHCLWRIVLRSPGASAAVPPALAAILIPLSPLKFEIVHLAR